jgi:hypothetical protein
MMRPQWLFGSSKMNNLIQFPELIPSTMAQKPLEILKKGLTKFSKKIKERKDALEAKLARKETISADDEHWLDHEANVVDEQRVIDNLEASSDYERGLRTSRLTVATMSTTTSILPTNLLQPDVTS